MLSFSITLACEAEGCENAATAGASLLGARGTDLPALNTYDGPFKGWSLAPWNSTAPQPILCPAHARAAKEAADDDYPL